MATNIGSLVATLNARTGQFEAAINRSTKGVFALNNTVKAFGGVIAAAFGARAIKRSLQETITAFATQEEAVISLGAALRVTGKDGADALRLLTTNAAELQKVTTQGDEAIIAATASLAQLATELSAAELADAQRALIGIADTFLKGDVQNAALLLGKSIGSTTNALTRYGIQLDSSASQSEKLAAVVAQSNTFFSVTEARTQSLSGRMQQLQNVVGDLREAIGAAIAGRIGLPDALTRLRDLTGDIIEVVAAGGPFIQEAFATVGKLAGVAFVSAFFDALGAALQKFADLLRNFPILGFIQNIPGSPARIIENKILPSLRESSDMLTDILGGMVVDMQNIVTRARAANQAAADAGGGGGGGGAGVPAGPRALMGAGPGGMPTITGAMGAGAVGLLAMDPAEFRRRSLGRMRMLEMEVEAFTNASGKVANLSDALQSALASSFESIGTALGDLLVNITKGFKGLGAAILATLGSIMQALGRALIAFGVAGVAIKRFVLNPAAAIAAGVGLVALGGALQSTASNIVTRGGSQLAGAGGPVGVRVEEFGPNAKGDLRGPERVTIQLFDAFGQPIEQTQVELARRTRRDAIVRVPVGASLGVA